MKKEPDSVSTIERLKSHFATLDGVTVAFSGGVDSTVLLSVACEVLGDRVLAVICHAPSHTAREIDEALTLAAQLGVETQLIHVDPLNDPGMQANDRRRCYHCKKVLFSTIMEAAAAAGLPTVVEGTNADDRGDYRPGFQAVRELGVRSPFYELDIGKTEIRRMAKARNLPVWNKPAAACLISRLPYDTEITEARLRRIEAAEETLRAADIWPARARDHGDLLRVETDPELFTALLAPLRRTSLVAELKALGYAFVAFDLEGYRTGAMNETLRHPKEDADVD
ncbi:MAG: ATP-dependent sacrificial sulfur transferase LarE [Candidatus Lernaella stagnicola]|nr:ATP-dependent sacrificial sulfur transferase LarE [Candidatus Lernaella stagnicola]